MVLEMDFVSINIMADLIHSFTFKVHGYETSETCNNGIHVIKLYEICSTTSIYGNKNTSLPSKYTLPYPCYKNILKRNRVESEFPNFC